MGNSWMNSKMVTIYLFFKILFAKFGCFFWPNRSMLIGFGGHHKMGGNCLTGSQESQYGKGFD